eukprot:365771-Chlamydomonas_euryale.AAC.5
MPCDRVPGAEGLGFRCHGLLFRMPWDRVSGCYGIGFQNTTSWGFASAGAETNSWLFAAPNTNRVPALTEVDLFLPHSSHFAIATDHLFARHTSAAEPPRQPAEPGCLPEADAGAARRAAGVEVWGHREMAGM